jgi:hypothetical protein
MTTSHSNDYLKNASVYDSVTNKWIKISKLTTEQRRRLLGWDKDEMRD